MGTRMPIAALAASLLLGGCHAGTSRTPVVDQPWVRLAAVPGRPAAGYFTLRGGSVPARLVAIESPKATSIELHESMKSSGDATGMAGMTGAMMTMKPVEGIDVPARGTVRFAPGGYHAMIFGLDPAIKAGDSVPLSFRFAKGPSLAVEARAVAAGDPGPS